MPTTTTTDAGPPSPRAADAPAPLADPRALEPALRAIAHRLAAGYPRRGPTDWLEATATERLGREPELRAALFRVVDVAPACAGPDDLAAHVGALLADTGRPAAHRLGRIGRARPLARRATAAASGAAVRHMAHRFIVGETPAAALPALRQLWERGAAASVDLLGEATVTPAEADAYLARCLDTLRTLTAAAPAWPARPQLEHDAIGSLARVNLSVKVTALTPLVRAEAPQRGRDDAAARLRELLRAARDLGAHLHVDMESMDARDLIHGLVLDLLAEPEFRAGPSAGVVLQAYLVDADEQLTQLLDWASATERAHLLTIRLVKGAYWDHETVQARQSGWTPPVFAHKAESDRSFEDLTRRLLAAHPHVRTAIASHNLRSVAHAAACARALGLHPGAVEYQVLRGLGDDLQVALAAEGLRVRTYCPIGDLVAGMAYLVRRLLENTANDSFLASRASGADLDDLLRTP